LVQERLVAILSAVFGGLALVLAGLGLYGVMSHMVTRRRREIGIRMALGASPRDMLQLVLARVSLLLAVGVSVGAVAALWASKFIASLLYGLGSRDLATMVAAAAVLGAVGLCAGWLPALRAARTDPAVVLRSE